VVMATGQVVMATGHMVGTITARKGLGHGAWGRVTVNARRVVTPHIGREGRWSCHRQGTESPEPPSTSDVTHLGCDTGGEARSRWGGGASTWQKAMATGQDGAYGRVAVTARRVGVTGQMVRVTVKARCICPPHWVGRVCMAWRKSSQYDPPRYQNTMWSGAH